MPIGKSGRLKYLPLKASYRFLSWERKGNEFHPEMPLKRREITASLRAQHARTWIKKYSGLIFVA